MHAGALDDRMTKSNYDCLLERYSEIAVSKTGTAYEILAALVCNILDDGNAVIHDIKLRGTSGVKHQIDVSVETGQGKQALLIECKDFSVGNRKVGLGVVRNFQSAVADIQPDEAWIITCVGFTLNARKFAKGKGIKLIVLRMFEQDDEVGRIKSIVLNVHVPTIKIVNIDICGDKLLNQAMRKAGVTSPIGRAHDVTFECPRGERMHFLDLVSKEAKVEMDLTKTSGRGTVEPSEYKLFVAGNEVPYVGVFIDYAVTWETETRRMFAEKIAELILQGVGDADIIIFDDQLRRHHIDPATGRIDKVDK